MADVYQIPDGNTPQFTIPIGGFGGNGGMFGNGFNSIADLFGLAIIASMFGWNGNGGFGGNNNGAAGFLSNQLNNDSGRQLIMQAVTTQGEASRTAIASLASTIGQDFNLVNGAVQNVQNALNTIAANQGMNALQVVNAIQAGDASLASQFSQCCCQQQLAMANQTAALQNGMLTGFNGVLQGINGVNQSIAAKSAADQLAMCQQTNALTNGANANTQAILAKLGEMQTQGLQDKLDAARAENTRLSGEISQANQNNVIAGMIGNAVNPLAAQLAGIRSEVDAIKRCQPSTITLPNNSMTAVPTIWANAVADNIVDRINAALTPETATTPAA